MSSRRAPAGGNRAPSGPRVKEEPEEGEILLDLPEAARRTHEVGPNPFYSAPKVPFRPPNSDGSSDFEPPAETISWPDSSPFPRALHHPDSWADFSNRQSANSRDRTGSRPEREAPAQYQIPQTTSQQPNPGNRGREQKRSKRDGRKSAMPAPANRPLRTIPMGLSMYSQPAANAAPVKPTSLHAAGSGRLGAQPSAPRNDSTNPTRAGPVPTELLSLECQRRHFNPQWVLKEKRNGTYTCDVKLLQHTITGDGVYRSMMDAKYAVAEKALKLIQSWPNPSGWLARSQLAKQNGREHLENTCVNQQQRALARTAPKKEEDAVMADAPPAARDGRSARVPSGNQGRDRAAEETEVREQVQRMTVGRLPERKFENAESARAYLEGLMDGSRLVGPGYRLPERNFGNAELARIHLEGMLDGARLVEPAPRGRSRSPDSAHRPSNHRERSPIGVARSSSPSSRAAPSPESHRTGGIRDMDKPPAMQPPIAPPDYYPRRRGGTSGDKYRPEYPRGPSDKEWPHDKFRP